MHFQRKDATYPVLQEFGDGIMIIVQSPLRVSLFGGGTDFPDFYLNEGGAVLSTTIDKFIFVTAKWRFDHKLRVGYTKTELVDDLDGIEHELIREAFRLTGIRSGVEITTMGDIPSEGSGLGSSSTVTVGALLALHELRGIRVPTEKLAEDACRIEIDILGKPIGIQDQYAAAFGGMRHIEFTQEGIVRLNPVRLSAETIRRLNENLLLFYTGTTRSSAKILEEQRDKIEERSNILREMKGLVSLAKTEIEAGNLDEIGHMLHYTWVLKKRLASKISNPELDEMYNAGRGAGALGGKIIGAGGGGFLMLYCPNGTRDAVRSSLAKLRELPFRLEPDGAKVILNYPRSVTTNDIAHETRQEFVSVKSFVQRSKASEQNLNESNDKKKTDIERVMKT
jgi:D-glycero-alpha-D-manno-heptose-7-phosphate kinase